MEKRYETQHTIGYFEADNRLTLTLSTLMVYLQDAAILHSDSLGYTLDYMAEHKRGWAVVNWHIAIERMPKRGETIKIWTWSNHIRRMQAQRSYYIYDEAGNIIIRVASRWVFMDLERRRPVSIVPGMEERYGESPICAIEQEKYTLPSVEEGEVPFIRQFSVTRRDTDTNGHANNVKYVEWAMDDVPDEIYDTMQVYDVKVVYRKECYKGSKVQSKCYVRQVEKGVSEVISYLCDAEDEKVVFAQVASLWKTVSSPQMPEVAEKGHSISK